MEAPWMKVALGVIIVSAIVLFVRESAENAEKEAWTRLAQAREPSFTAEALEDARLDVEGTPAEPWTDYYLATLLYEENTDLDRARQVAADSISKHPDHATSAMLSRLIEALDTYPAGN